MKETNINPNIYDTSIRLLFLALITGWCLSEMKRGRTKPIGTKNHKNRK